MDTAITQILDVARWAPSGDNAQPWQFKLKSHNEILISVHIDECNVYEFRNGEPTIIAAGMLLENIVSAAPCFGKLAAWKYLSCENHTHLISVTFEDTDIQPDQKVIEMIKARSVDRRPYKRTALNAAQKDALAGSLGPEFGIDWHERPRERLKIAALSKLATQIRLSIPETFPIHSKIVDWANIESPDSIPARALGLDPLTLRIMRLTLKSWKRTAAANKLGSPMFAALQMDLLPGYSSAGYFAVYFQDNPSVPREAPQDLLRLGQAMQRFWLKATDMELALQPAFAVLAFSHYGRTASNFTVSATEKTRAKVLSTKVESAFRHPPAFLGRIGFPTSTQPSRSIRLNLAQLLQSDDATP